MSLVTQMVRDLEVDSPQPQVEKRGELPLFAAANILYGKHHQPTAKRARIILLIALLFALILILVDRVLLPSQYKLRFSDKVESNSFVENQEVFVDEADLYSDVPVIKQSNNEFRLSNKNAKELNQELREVGETTATLESEKTEAISVMSTDTAENIELPLKDKESKTIQQNIIKTKRSLSDREIDINHYEKALSLLGEHGAVAAINYLNNHLSSDINNHLNNHLISHQEKAAEDIKASGFFKSIILHASLLIETQRFSQAEVLIGQYQKVYPSNNDFSKLKIRLLMAQKNYPQVLSLLDSLSMPINVDAEFEELRAVSQQAQGQYVDAQNTYKKLLEFDNRSARWWMGLAVAFDSSADFKSAEQAYHQVLLSEDLTAEHNTYALRRITDISR